MPPCQRASPSSELGEETPRHHLPATQGSGHELAHGEPAQMHRSGGGADEAHAFTPLNSREEHRCVDTQSVIRSAGPILPPASATLQCIFRLKIDPTKVERAKLH